MNIGLLGFGTVGRGFYELAENSPDIKITAVLSRRPRPELKCLVTDSFEELLANGVDITKYRERDMVKLRGKLFSMVFQDPMTALDPTMTVGSQIAEAVITHDSKLPKSKVYSRVIELMELVGIQQPEQRYKLYPYNFSGGMRQRSVMAIALAANPQILLADEPTTALDVTIQAQILDLLKDIQKKLNTATILVSHDLGVVARAADRVAIMYAGYVMEIGSLEDIFDHKVHPYTEGLFNSLPKINNKGSQLKPIPGLMVDPANLPVGCAFADRCKYATDKCREKRPETRRVSDTHTVTCSRYDEPDFHIEGVEE